MKSIRCKTSIFQHHYQVTLLPPNDLTSIRPGCHLWKAYAKPFLALGVQPFCRSPCPQNQLTSCAFKGISLQSCVLFIC